MSADHARDSWILRVSGKAHERLPKRRNGAAAVTGGGCPKTLKEPALASAILVEAMASKYAMNPSPLMWTLARPATNVFGALALPWVPFRLSHTFMLFGDGTREVAPQFRTVR